MPKNKKKNTSSQPQESKTENSKLQDNTQLQTQNTDDMNINQNNDQNVFSLASQQNKGREQQNDKQNEQSQQHPFEASRKNLSHPTQETHNLQNAQHNQLQNQTFLLSNAQHTKTQELLLTTETQNPQFIKDSEKAHKQLLDGLTLVGKVAQEIFTHSPLQHEKDIHGGSQKFTQNFDPAIYHYLEVTLQKSLKQIDGNQQNQKQKQEPIQVIQSIKDSQQQQNSINKSQEIIQIIKSCTSSDEQPLEYQISAQLDPPRKDNIGIIPQSEIPSKGLSSSQRLQINQQKLNSQILEEREKEWTKIQEMEAKPRKPSFQLTHQKNISINVPKVQPNQIQHLSYSNNLPLIQSQKQKSNQKNSENTSNNPKSSIFQKLLLSGLASGVCAGALSFKKTESKVTLGVTLGIFLLTYFIQK